MLKNLFILLLISLLPHFVAAQEDTLTVTPVHNPKRAAVLSAVIPGSGQIYNEFGYRRVAGKKHRAWWKAPLIYGGLAACGYYFHYNNQYANLTKQEYLYRADHPGVVYDQRFAGYTSQDMLINGNEQLNIFGYEDYARRRDYLLVGFVGIWALNVLEAYVDGHFVTFDVSEDLSLSWHPAILPGYQPGLQLHFSFQ